MKQLKKSIFAVMIVLLFACFAQPVFASEKGKININAATKKDLIKLKFIGDALAKRIIEYRDKKPFEAKEEIMKVKGVGKKIFEANKDRIIVSDEKSS